MLCIRAALNKAPPDGEEIICNAYSKSCCLFALVSLFYSKSIMVSIKLGAPSVCGMRSVCGARIPHGAVPTCVEDDVERESDPYCGPTLGSFFCPLYDQNAAFCWSIRIQTPCCGADQNQKKERKMRWAFDLRKLPVGLGRQSWASIF